MPANPPAINRAEAGAGVAVGVTSAKVAPLIAGS